MSGTCFVWNSLLENSLWAITGILLYLIGKILHLKLITWSVLWIWNKTTYVEGEYKEVNSGVTCSGTKALTKNFSFIVSAITFGLRNVDL